MSKMTIENNVKPELFKAFINDFANALYPAYEEASGSGNIKIANVNQRLKVMFVAMCNYFGWNIDEIGKPFESEDTWTWDAITSENSEADDDKASTDEDSPAMGSFINEPTMSFGSSKITLELHSLQRITRMEFLPVLTMMESVAGSYIPNWKLRLLFMMISFPQIFCTIQQIDNSRKHIGIFGL